MTLLPLLLLQAAEPRLDAKVTLEAPRMTYAEFGGWVGKQAGVPVYVTPTIRERKLTVLVEDRPLKEIMDHVADALFLRWEPTKEGLTLKLQDGVAAEEAGAAAATAGAAREALRQKLDDFVRYANDSPDRLKDEEDKLREQAAGMEKDPTLTAKARRAELLDRMSTVSNLRYNGQQRGAAKVYAALSPAQRNALFSGISFYFSNRPALGFAPIPDGVLAAYAENSSGFDGKETTLFSVRYDPNRGSVQVSSGTSASDHCSGMTLSLDADDSNRAREARALTPFVKRMVAWQKTDPATKATPLAPRKDSHTPRRHTQYRTLADLLVELHARSGVPIVADGFRLAIVAKRPPDGKTLAEWNGTLNPWSDGRFRGYRPALRTQDGWVMMRHARYWQQLPREVPEGPIRRLEVAARSGPVSLGDAAAFVAATTPTQERYLSPTDLVMDAPSASVANGPRFLRLWASLPSVLRRNAASERGLETRSIPTASYRLLLACLEERRGSVFANEKELPYLLPGGPPLPADLRLFVNLDANTMNYDEVYDGDEGGIGWQFPRDGVPGVSARIGVFQGPSFQSYEIPLRPSRKLWPDTPTG